MDVIWIYQLLGHAGNLSPELSAKYKRRQLPSNTTLQYNNANFVTAVLEEKRK